MFLQPVDLLRYGRLGQVQALRRTCVAALLSDFQKSKNFLLENTSIVSMGWEKGN